MAKHFAVGLVVSVRDGEIPTGLEEWEGRVPKRRPIASVADDGTFEVGGWWWRGDQIESDHSYNLTSDDY